MEARIAQHLSEHADTLRSDKRFAVYYSDALSSPGPAGTVARAARTPSTSKTASKLQAMEASVASKLAALSPSPKALKAVGQRTVALRKSFGEQLVAVPSWNKTKKAALAQRAAVSNFNTVVGGAAALETFYLLSSLVPLTRSVQVPEFLVKYWSPHGMYLPDYMQFLELQTFWKPLGTWLVLVYLVPLLIGSAFNMSHKHGRSLFDPVTMAVARCALVWAVFVFGALPNMISTKTLVVLDATVGATLLKADSLILLVFALYDSLV